MSDRELLEKAARAYGAEDVHAWSDKLAILKPGADDFVLWNPLEDDGDAFRLAVKLGIFISPASGSRRHISEAYELGFSADGKAELHKEDAFAATRRAITRAAAAIGEQI